MHPAAEQRRHRRAHVGHRRRGGQGAPARIGKAARNPGDLRTSQGNEGVAVSGALSPGSDLRPEGSQRRGRGREVPTRPTAPPPAAHGQLTLVARPCREFHLDGNPHPPPHEAPLENQEWPRPAAGAARFDKSVQVEPGRSGVHHPTPIVRNRVGDGVAQPQRPYCAGRRQLQDTRRIRIQRIACIPQTRGRLWFAHPGSAAPLGHPTPGRPGTTQGRATWLHR